SDLALRRPLPEAVREMVAALVGCIAGAVLVDETERLVRAAGLTDIRLTPKPGYVETMRETRDPLYNQIVASLPEGTQPGDYIVSLDIAATKAGAAQACCQAAARQGASDAAPCCEAAS